MEKIPFRSNDLSLDYRQKMVSGVPAKVTFQLPGHFLDVYEMYRIKYSDLFNITTNYIARESLAENPQRTVDNFKSACRSWLVFLKKDEQQSIVGPELNNQFEAKLKEFLSELKVAKLSAPTIRDRKSSITKLYHIYQTHLSCAKNERSADIAVELRRLLHKADWSIADLVQHSGVSNSFIQRVINSKKPKGDKWAPTLRRLETAFLKKGVVKHQGHLTELLSLSTPEASTNLKLHGEVLSQTSLKEARLSFSNKSARPIPSLTITQLKSDFPIIYEFLLRYRVYKVSTGSWVIRPVESNKFACSWVFNHDGIASYSPSFDSYLATALSYLSYLCEYRRLALEKLDSVETLINGQLMVSYMVFLKDRRGGILGGNGKRFRAFSTEMFKETTRQVKEGLLQPPNNFGHIHSAHDSVSAFVKKSSDKKIRNPWEKLAPFFDLEEPAKPFVDISVALLKDSCAPQTFLADAIGCRDALLLRLLAAIPLREGTVTSLVYHADNSGHLKYSEKEGAWLLDIPANIIKNQVPIRRTLPKSLTPLIETYLGEARPRILLAYKEALSKEWLFVAKKRRIEEGGKVYLDEDGCPYSFALGQMGVSVRLAWLTEKFLGIPIRTHAFRHLMATRFLKQNPGQFQACADLLADRIETVTKHYAFHDAKWNERLLNDSIEKVFG